MMAQAEIESGARLFYRKPDANTWGILNVREDFAARTTRHRRARAAGLRAARGSSLAHPAELAAILAGGTKLPAPVVARQLERTELTHGRIGEPQRETILAAGLALQEAGVVEAGMDVAGTLSTPSIDPHASRPTARVTRPRQRILRRRIRTADGALASPLRLTEDIP